MGDCPGLLDIAITRLSAKDVPDRLFNVYPRAKGRSLLFSRQLDTKLKEMAAARASALIGCPG